MFPSTCGINNSDILPINDNSIRNYANNNNPILQLKHLKCKVEILFTFDLYNTTDRT
jgi:hypothetical protein